MMEITVDLNTSKIIKQEILIKLGQCNRMIREFHYHYYLVSYNQETGIIILNMVCAGIPTGASDHTEYSICPSLMRDEFAINAAKTLITDKVGMICRSF